MNTSAYKINPPTSTFIRNWHQAYMEAYEESITLKIENAKLRDLLKMAGEDIDRLHEQRNTIIGMSVRKMINDILKEAGE